MCNIYFDPSQYINGIHQALLSDKKRIGFLFGAGTSLAKKNRDSITIPAMDNLTNEIVAEISSENKKYDKLFKEMKEELEKKFNIETILNRLEIIPYAIGKANLNNLTKEEYELLIEKVKKLICDKVKFKNFENIDYNSMIQSDFAEWVINAERNYCIEIFTTNYDLLIEYGLESKNVPYYDGFIGSINPFFYPESIEEFNYLPKQTKLWKIHGSLNWYYEEKTKKIIRKESDKSDILIYPSIEKYFASKKQPYISFLDRLYYFIKKEDSILFTCGYSFRDEHINERIFSALNSNTTTHVYAFIYDKYYDENKGIKYSLPIAYDIEKLSKENSNISFYGCRNAIIGGKLGIWKLRKEPDKDETLNINSYFDEDASVDVRAILKSEDNNNIEDNKGNEIWTGEGELTLPYFTKFVNFLNSMNMYIE